MLGYLSCVCDSADESQIRCRQNVNILLIADKIIHPYSNTIICKEAYLTFDDKAIVGAYTIPQHFLFLLEILFHSLSLVKSI